jgi:hypothetical protein
MIPQSERPRRPGVFPPDDEPRPIWTAVHNRAACLGQSVVIRHWEPEDAARCRRCGECTAYVGHGDERGRYDGAGHFDGDTSPVMICVQHVPTEDLYEFLFG